MHNRYSATSNAATYDNAVPPHLKLRNVVIGVLISLLLHATVAFWTWNLKLTATQEARTQSRPLEVRLMHEIEQIPAPVAPLTTTQTAPVTHRTPTSRQTLTIVKSETVTTAAPITVIPANPASTEKHLDLNAIHANLGTIVAQVDRENRDTPVGQLQTKPLYPQDDQSKMGKAIDQTTRPDCRDNIANTGLLSPLFLLAMVADKKDGGCKW
jgi:hypothetical protein